jgi:5-formyltetrahydrofolate cyclo-ligase
MIKDEEITPEAEASLRHLQEHAKTELRSRMRAVRRVLPLEACSARAKLAVARLSQLPEFERARTVIGYSAMRKELDPSALLTRAASLGKRVGLPRVEGDGLELHAYLADDALEEGAWGVLEPLPSAPIIADAEVDLIVVPALALDAHGYRLGYGQAFYDRLLPRLGRAFYVGVAYDFQLVAELPKQAHDVAVHCIVTDTRTLRI